MADIQAVGATKQKLKEGPKSMDRSKFKGGQMQHVGATMTPTSPKAVPLQYDNTGIRGGQIQAAGATDVGKLSRTPHRGWDSASTPMSDRSWEQGKGGGK